MSDRPISRSKMAKFVLRYSLLGLGALAMIGPFAWMLVTSLTGDAQLARVDAHLLPTPACIDSYPRLGDAFPFWRFVANSVGVAAVSTVVQLATSATAAYAFSRLRFPGS